MHNMSCNGSCSQHMNAANICLSPFSICSPTTLYSIGKQFVDMVEAQLCILHQFSLVIRYSYIPFF